MEALSGLKVIELGQFVAGPFAAKTLADFGADVIKVESAGAGDGLRKWRIVQDGTSLWWEIQSRNKRSVCLDLKSPEGRDVILELAKEADVVIENFKPGTLEKWGLGWETLHEINPKLVMLRISGFGQTGPYKDKPGFGVLGESMGGLRYITGEPGRVPVRTGISIGDTLASMHGVMGLMFALHHVNVHGGDGQVVDVALYESVFNVMESTLTEYTSAGVVRERSGSALPGIVPTNAYLCKDDQYVLIAGNGDSIFQRLMTEMGRQDLADDPELKHNDGRSRQVERIDAAIQEWAETMTCDEVIERLDAVSVPVGKTYTIADIVADPQYQARDMILDTTTSTGKPMKTPGIVPKMSATPGRVKYPAPTLGQHTDDLKQTGWPKRSD